MSQPPASLVQRLEAHSQQHLLRFWEDLDADQQTALQSEIEAIDFAQLKSLTSGSHEDADSGRIDRAALPGNLVTLETEDTADDWTAARSRGNAALAEGRVGVILVAGGQGTRLGFPHPKGMFPIGPVSKNPLFQILVEQVIARSQRSGKPIPYYVMTSDATHDETVKFFEQNNHFGLNADKVHFFKQGNMPAVDRATGKVLLADKHTIARSPDGHGGMLQALATSGLLDQMAADGIDLLYYHQVDNPTAIVADPALIGFHLQFESELSTKVVRKVSPTERMGVIVDVDGDLQIIEYSELSPEQAAREDAEGNWIFWAGNMAIHVFNRELLQRIAGAGLPFHLAKKNVPHIDENGVPRKPDDPANPNAIKFERFIFDALPLAKNALVVEASRAREFNPVKNREGSDSPETARAALINIARDWLQQAGQQLADDAIVEISPLRALEASDVNKQSDEELTGEVFVA